MRLRTLVLLAALFLIHDEARAQCGDTFRDQWESTSFANDDGTLTWSIDWIELGETGGAGNGDVKVSNDSGGSRIRIKGASKGIERQADLSGATSADFNFSYRRVGVDESTDHVAVEVSSNGGASWTELARIQGPGTDSSYQSVSYDLTSYIASNTRIRLLSSSSNGNGDTVFFDDVEINACGLGPHLGISHDGTGINCQVEPITVSAHDASHALDTGYGGTVTLSTSTGHGDWSLITGSGTLTNSGNGAGSYAFAVADAGQVVLGLSDTFGETVNIGLDDGSTTENSNEDPDLLFAAAGFNFLADGVKDAIGTQIANKGSDVAPGAQTLELQAVRTSDDSGACEAALQGSNTIDVAFECLDPNTCGARQVSVNGTQVAANDAGAPLGYTSLSLDFGGAADSTATVVVHYPEVGRIRLHARDTLSPSGEELLGASNSFVARPFGFHLTASGNPAATDESGGIYTTAGSDFSLSASVALWEAADDADSDGVPDGHDDADPSNNADLSNNLLGLRFGQEISPESVELSAVLFAPGGGNNPGLGGGTTLSSFSGGSDSTSTAYWDEVGIIEVVGATDGDYLGIGATESARASSRSGHVGRFTPHDFGVVYNTPSFITGCAGGGFSYLGEGIAYSVTPQVTFTAQSVHATTTQNYTGSWFKLAPTDPNALSYTAGSGTLATTAPNAPSVADLGLGLGRVSFDTGPTVSFSRTTPVAPFDAEISLSFNLLDGDDVAYSGNPARFANTTTGIVFSAGKEMRFGRLVLANAFGSELAALAVPLQAQYWLGSYFVTNAGDGCTPTVAGNLTLTPNPVALASIPTLGPTLSAGDAGLSLSPPGAGNTGFFDLLFDLSPGGQDLPWLQGDWDGDGFYDDNPVGRATFGVFSGSDQLIYRREIY